MRITLVITSLDRGGAERVLSVLANAWASQDKKVTIVTLDRSGPPALPLDPGITLDRLDMPPGRSRNAAQALQRNYQKILALRQAIRRSRSDVVISFMDRPNIVTLLATRFLSVPTVVCERVDPSLYKIGWMWGLLRRVCYCFADALVCQTDSALAWFKRRTIIRGHVVPNPVLSPSDPIGPKTEDRYDHSRATVGTGTVLAMGRLTHQKGFDLLLKAFAKIASKHPGWCLRIVGSGDLENSLALQVQRLGLGGRVTLTGETGDPAGAFSEADVFVLSSRFEGFPNALCEAMACGLPVVSFDCPSGPSVIIRAGVDGILVPPEDVEGLADKMDYLISNPEERARLGANGREVTQRFSLEKIVLLWEQLFVALLLNVRDQNREEAPQLRERSDVTQSEASPKDGTAHK